VANPLTTSLVSDKSAESADRDTAQFIAALFELGKPRLAALVMVTMLCGALTAPGPRDIVTVMIAMLGTALVVAAANALNMYIERDTDKLMRRTATRPLPTGRLQPEAAVWFAVTLACVGLGLLAVFVNFTATALTALALVSYVSVYTPLKRVTTLAMQVGALPGALPPLIGWASVTGSIDARGLTLFAFLFVWQLPHFLAITLFRSEEYARAGLKVLPNVRGVAATKRAIVMYSAVLLLISLAPVALGMAGAWYAVIAGALGLAFIVQGMRGFSTTNEQAWAKRLFFASMPYLVLVYASVVISAG
jgi:protoheme IX farnesyltransferase